MLNGDTSYRVSNISVQTDGQYRLCILSESNDNIHPKVPNPITKFFAFSIKLTSSLNVPH